jgi:ABC-type branched-subunit amino acid transport system permease subunit
MSIYWVTLLISATIYITIVLGLNIEYGIGGILNFSYITFVAVGAYVTAVVTLGKTNQYGIIQQYILGWSLPWPVALLLAGAASAVLSLVLLFAIMQRLRSDYMAISVVALGTVIWTIFGNVNSLFNGVQGLSGVPRPYSNLGIDTNGGLTGDLVFLCITSAIALASYLVARRIYSSPFGRLLRGVREDPDVVATFGRDVLRARAVAFVLGSFMAGVGGGLLVMQVGAWNPDAFLPPETFILFAAVIIGGSGRPLGAVVGTILVEIAFTEALRYLPNTFSASVVGGIQLIAIGLLLILMVRFRPQGLFPENTKKIYSRKPTPAAPGDAPPPLVSVSRDGGE